MKILLVGNGAREHAMAEAIIGSGAELYSFMKAKNPGIAALSKEFALGDINDGSLVAKWAAERKIDVAVVGPEAPLEKGVSDVLKKNGISCASPSRAAARLEWDKSFTRNLMLNHRIPGCPEFAIFNEKTKSEIESYIRELNNEVAVKPAGLTGGKGVKIAGEHLKNAAESVAYAQEIIREGIGTLKEVVIEEKLIGEEITLQAFVDGRRIAGMPCVQDHKRAFENDFGPNCYSEDTEILTENGWKTFVELQKTERVAIFQPRFRRIRFENPKTIYWKKYNGKMVSFKHREIDLLVTPNHRMLIQPRKGRARLKVIEARNWQGENYILQTGKWIGTTTKFFRIPKSRNRYGVKKKSICIAFEDWMEFLGLFLSEGYAIESGTSHGRVYICQTKNSRNFEKMKKILEKLPFKVTYEKDKFRINSMQLAGCLINFGVSHEKFVPKYVKESKPEMIELFLKAFCLGDGDIHYGKMRFHSASKKLIGDIQELLLKTGRVGVITVDKRKTMINPINKKQYPARPIYSIEIKKRNKTSIRKNNIKWIDYDGYTGCVTVSTGFIVVRRNNRVAICGNTGGMGSYSDSRRTLPFMTEQDYENAVSIMQKVVDALRATNAEYRGALYGQFMLTRDGPKVIEFNARFGDPEAMNVLPVMKTSYAEVLQQIADGKVSNAEFEQKATVCKYLVPEGYPDNPKAKQQIRVNEGEMRKLNARAYYANVSEEDGIVYTSSSRAVGVLGIANSIDEAERIAEAACSKVQGPLFHRKDIGTKRLVQKRIDHMKKLRQLFQH